MPKRISVYCQERTQEKFSIENRNIARLFFFFARATRCCRLILSETCGLIDVLYERYVDK